MTHKYGGHSMPPICATVYRYIFYIEYRWIKEKGSHVIYENNAINILYADKLEIL